MPIHARKLGFLSATCLALVSGCEEPRHTAGNSAQAPAPAKEPDTFIVGKRTQDVRKLTPEEDARGHAANPAIIAKDPITLSGNAYVSSVGRVAVMNIEHAMDLYHAANDRYPKDYDEFMTEIIKANNIALPQLPHYQKYAYDETQHKLVVWEYPDLKGQPPQGR